MRFNATCGIPSRHVARQRKHMVSVNAPVFTGIRCTKNHIEREREAQTVIGAIMVPT